MAAAQPETLLSLRDVRAVGKLAIWALLAWGVPERFWGPTCRGIARGLALARPGRRRAVAARVRAIAGPRGLAIDPADAEREMIAVRLLRSLQVMKVHHPRGFQPDARVVGREHLDAALARGRGAILWAATFQLAHLIEPLALARAGIALHQLGNWNHGMGLRTRVGVRLNRVVVAAEERYLAERIVVEPGSLAALVALRERLSRNLVVGMRATDYARSVLELPFLAGRLRLATGPVELALATGAALLPVFTVRTRAGHHEVHVEAPLVIQAAGDRQARIESACAEHVARLEPWVLRFPEQWRAWERQAHPASHDDDVAIRTVASISHVLGTGPTPEQGPG